MDYWNKLIQSISHSGKVSTMIFKPTIKECSSMHTDLLTITLNKINLQTKSTLEFIIYIVTFSLKRKNKLKIEIQLQVWSFQQLGWSTMNNKSMDWLECHFPTTMSTQQSVRMFCSESAILPLRTNWIFKMCLNFLNLFLILVNY